LRLQALRARRDPAAAERRRAALVEAAREGRNVLPPLVDAVTDLVTLGEIIDSLRSVFGDHRETAAW
ncbi:MAG TPA: methylmalonyl-CoA mutase family protein, partial [Thermoanaerobaculia bacterium]|nr:methylmalonyl-CoA mutase family protein [Thermoanaerobaculia bacterium]